MKSHSKISNNNKNNRFQKYKRRITARQTPQKNYLNSKFNKVKMQMKIKFNKFLICNNSKFQ